MATIEERERKKYPGADLAYPVAMQSYEWAARRLDAIDLSLDKLLLWSVTVTAGIVTLVADTDKPVNFYSCWFVLSMVFFVACVAVALVRRFTGQLLLVYPDSLYRQWIKLSDTTYKVNAVYWAGENFKHNRDLINNKGRVVTACVGLAVAEVVCIVLWIITSPL